MTFNVFGGTLNLTQLQLRAMISLSYGDVRATNACDADFDSTCRRARARWRHFRLPLMNESKTRLTSPHDIDTLYTVCPALGAVHRSAADVHITVGCVGMSLSTVDATLLLRPAMTPQNSGESRRGWRDRQANHYCQPPGPVRRPLCDFYHPRRGVVIVRVYVCNTITFESLDVDSLVLVCGYILLDTGQVRT